MIRRFGRHHLREDRFDHSDHFWSPMRERECHLAIRIYRSKGAFEPSNVRVKIRLVSPLESAFVDERSTTPKRRDCLQRKQDSFVAVGTRRQYARGVKKRARKERKKGLAIVSVPLGDARRRASLTKSVISRYRLQKSHRHRYTDRFRGRRIMPADLITRAASRSREISHW